VNSLAFTNSGTSHALSTDKAEALLATTSEVIEMTDADSPVA